MKMLALDDLSESTEKEVKEHIISGYIAGDKRLEDELQHLKILIASESVGSWGCDASSWFLLIDPATGQLYENYGSHCSCHGFEDQWDLETTDFAYLASYFCVDGAMYSSDETKRFMGLVAERIELLSKI